MDTIKEYRERYSLSSDVDLLSLLTAGPDTMTPQAWQALLEEVRRRHLSTGATPLPPMPADARFGPGRYAKASIGARFVAWIIDNVVGFVPIGGAILLMAMTGERNATATNVIILLAAVGWAFYYTFAKDGFEGGQSFGKKAMNLMVVKLDTNRPCGVGDSCLRALVMLLLQLIPVAGWLIEPIALIVDDDGRRLGDKAVGTQVIDASSYQPTT